MYRNERGFVYPLTFIIILAALFLLSIHLEQYLSEKRLLEEAETVLKQEYYLFNAVKRTESALKEHKKFNASGNYHYSHGEVTYSIMPLTETLYQITFKTIIDSNSPTISYAYYDTDLKKMIKWIEKN